MGQLEGDQTLEILNALKGLYQVGVEVEGPQLGTPQVLDGLDAVEGEVQFEQFGQFVQVLDEVEFVVI